MSTNELRSQDCIGTENECAVCGTTDGVDRFGKPGLPSVYACLSCAPAGGQSYEAFLEEEFL